MSVLITGIAIRLEAKWVSAKCPVCLAMFLSGYVPGNSS